MDIGAWQARLHQGMQRDTTERLTQALELGTKRVEWEAQTGALYQPRGVGGKGDGREVQKGGDICIPMADSC